MSKINKKRILIFLGALLAVLALALWLYKSVIFQEGNPAPLVRGIIQLNFTPDKIVKLAMAGDKYLTKSKNGQEIIKDFMQDKGYEFTEQMGSGYFFKLSNGKGAITIHKYYSRYYSLWSIIENSDSGRSDFY
jgi:hypothetical protein